MNNFEKREEFRVKMWKGLNIVFPKMVFRQVVDLIGETQTRVMFDLLKNQKFAYWPFVIAPNLPEDMEPQYRCLFENPKFMIAVNALRIAKIETYVENRWSAELRDFLEMLLHYLKATEKCFRMNLSNKVSNCALGEIQRAKTQFQQVEESFMQRLMFLPLEEKYIVCCVAALCLEELSEKSLDCLLVVWLAQRSILMSIA